ncbi:MAG: hypothetical protein H0T76_20240 [Nannocystis sp.]|nr:hypothetical protein [Nannocystis sp.]MBA3548819.1 hypothetical protein [Nannocystis sp.]
MKEKFKDINFRQDSRVIIQRANVIIAEYQARGFKLTLRQLYYQFVARDLLPNKQSEYKRLGGIIDNARQAGMIDWSAIEDRTRNLKKESVWRSPAQILMAVADQYREDWWAKQPIYPEVWIEKDALTGVIEGVCQEYQVPYFACRGYASQSEMYDAAKRLQNIKRNGRQPVIFHLGDHDPSGLDMTRDNGDRLSLFGRFGVRVVRLALNMDQIDQYGPPPNPAKETDSRFDGYESEYGTTFSWELDALSPEVIDQMIRDALDEEIDPDAWAKAKVEEGKNRATLTEASANWLGVKRYLKHHENEINFAVDDTYVTVDEILSEMERSDGSRVNGDGDDDDDE